MKGLKLLLKILGFTIIITSAILLMPIPLSHQPLPLKETSFTAIDPQQEKKPLSQQLYELEGRGAGTAWEKHGADILAAYFQQIGLQPLFEDASYLQHFLIGTVESFQENGRIRFRTTGLPNFQSQNVIGYLPGKDPEGKWVIFGAHYDGQGIINEVIYPSANDNLSGIMALAALAKNLANEPQVNYTLAFVAFGAEEPGLLGSSYLVENLPVPLEKIQAVINLDTIGKTSDTLLIYASQPNPLPSLLAPIFERYNYKTSLIIANGISDHYPFYLKGIPSVTITTANWKEGNHTPEDTLDKINLRQVGSVAGALKQSLYYLMR